MTVTIDGLAALGCSVELANEIVASIAVAGPNVLQSSVAAAGIDFAGATQLFGDLIVVTSATFGTADGVKFPSFKTSGKVSRVFNRTTSPIRLYPSFNQSFAGRTPNEPIYIAPGKVVTITAISATLAFAEGEMVSDQAGHWVHQSSSITNQTAFTTQYTIPVLEQEGVCIDGYFRGAYVGKTTAAAAIEGKFAGAAFRSAGGSLTICPRVQFYQDGATSDATALVSGTPPVTSLVAANGQNTAGVYTVDTNFAADITPAIRIAVSSNDLVIQSRGVATDTIRLVYGFKITTFSGQ